MLLSSFIFCFCSTLDSHPVLLYADGLSVIVCGRSLYFLVEKQDIMFSQERGNICWGFF